MITTNIHGIEQVRIERNGSDGTVWTTFYFMDKEGSAVASVTAFRNAGGTYSCVVDPDEVAVRELPEPGKNLGSAG